MTTDLTAEAWGLIRDEHERLAGLLMFAIDVVDDAQLGGHRIDVLKMRQKFGRKIRDSLVGREIALSELGDPTAELCCGICGAEADLGADDPLGDWSMGRGADCRIAVLCATCSASDDEEAAA